MRFLQSIAVQPCVEVICTVRGRVYLSVQPSALSQRFVIMTAP